MVFWTIVFFTLSLIGLVKGSVFKSFRKNMRELELRKLNGATDKEYTTDWFKLGCFPFVVVTILLIAEITYIIKALGYDPYKYPTIAAIILVIIGFIKTKKTKKTTEMNEYELAVYKADMLKPDKRKFSSTIKLLLWVIYFGYMFYVLVF